EYMAVLKGVSLEQLAQQTTDNFATLLHIDPARLQPDRKSVLCFSVYMIIIANC
ncbi:hypothetical protein ACG0Y7_26425, partial [Klebsiella pneumoniae]